MLGKALEAIRKQVERCDTLLGFNTTMSMSGGFGGGFASLLADKMKSIYTKNTSMHFGIMPTVIDRGYEMKLHPVEAYNTEFSVASLNKTSSLIFMLENGTYIKMAEKLGIEAPNLCDVNMLMAHAVSSVTTPSRYRNGNLNDLATSLGCYELQKMKTLDYLPRNQVGSLR